MAEHSLLNFELQYFLQISKEKSFLSAAENLGISQPALSRAMDRLEEQLGFKVFLRSRSGIELTAQGSEFLSRIRPVNENIDSILKNIRDQSTDLSGEIRIGGHRSVLEDFILPLYPSLVSEFPLIRFHLETKLSKEVLAGVIERQIDIGLVINPIEYSHLIFRTLGPAKGLFYSEVKSPSRFYLHPQMMDMNRLLRVLKKKLLNENNVHFVDDYDLIAELVQKKMGCGLLPDHVGKRFGLRVDMDLSSLLRMNFDLRLVTSADHLDDKKRKVLRFLERQIKP